MSILCYKRERVCAIISYHIETSLPTRTLSESTGVFLVGVLGRGFSSTPVQLSGSHSQWEGCATIEDPSRVTLWVAARPGSLCDSTSKKWCCEPTQNVPWGSTRFSKFIRDRRFKLNLIRSSAYLKANTFHYHIALLYDIPPDQMLCLVIYCLSLWQKTLDNVWPFVSKENTIENPKKT